MRFAKILGATLLVLPSTSALAATSDTIVLSGTVSSTLGVTCTDLAGATTLDFDGGSSEAIVQVSDCNATTNDDAGLTLTFNPDANFTGAASDVFAFAVESVTDAAAAPATGVFPANDVDDTWASAASGTTDADVYIKFNQDATVDPGTYSANIAVTASDNS
jgi:hypothetical protein